MNLKVVSFRREIRIVLSTLGVLLFLPIIAVVVIANAGVMAVSAALVSVNPVTHLVEIFDSNGNKVAERELSTTWPVHGSMSDAFGTLDEVRAGMGLNRHTGQDIAAPFGTSITPFTAGKVVAVHEKDDNTCGLYVRVDHGGNVQSLYCHMSKISATVNQEVKPGDVIGYVGSTGASTGNHVHFQINVNGIPVNPIMFMIGIPER